MAQNMTGCKHHLDEFGKLLAAGKLSREDQTDFLESLRTEKELEWVRSIRPFRRTMTSWQSRYGSSGQTTAACHPLAVLVAIVFAAFLMVLCSDSFTAQQSQSMKHHQQVAKKKQKKGKKKQRSVIAKKKQKKGKKKQRGVMA